MFRKSLILLVLLGACKMTNQVSPGKSVPFKALKIAETGGFTGGLAPITFKANGVIHNTEHDSIALLASEQLSILHSEARQIATFPSYQGGAGNLQREIWLMRETDTLYYRWPIEDTTKTAKTLNVSFGRLYRLLP